MGPPGAGKGTQAAKVSQTLEIPHISTGEMLRTAIREDTPLGRSVKDFLDQGHLVTDEVMNSVVADRLRRDDCKRGFLLDGYPRTLPQVRALDELLARLKSPLTVVLALEVDADHLIERLVKRGKEQGRSDDTEEVIRERQRVYRSDTQPLIDYYAKSGILRRVDGLGSIDEVFGRIVAACKLR